MVVVVCGDGTPSADDDYLLVGMRLGDHVPLPGSGVLDQLIYSMVFDTDGETGNNWVFQGDFDWDQFQSSDTWFQLFIDDDSASMSLTDAADLSQPPTAAKAIISWDTIVFAIPVTELGGLDADAYRGTSFLHDGTFQPAASGGDVTGDDPTQPLEPIDPDIFFDAPSVGARAGDCPDDVETICLNDDRFRVTTNWNTGSDSGPGSPLIFNEDDAAFFVFQPPTTGLVVQVLNGCDVNGAWWVFAAAATDIEYTLTVTDTVTGDSRAYLNPLGTPPEAITDTTAFATCP